MRRPPLGEYKCLAVHWSVHTYPILAYPGVAPLIDALSPAPPG